MTPGKPDDLLTTMLYALKRTAEAQIACVDAILLMTRPEGCDLMPGAPNAEAVARAAAAAMGVELPGDQPAPAGGPACSHPEDERLNVASMGNPNAWLCGLCNYEGGRTSSVEG